jgi:hypothetical protein
MNRPRDDEYGSLRDLMGGEPDDAPGDESEPADAMGDDTAEDPGDPADSDVWAGLPTGMQAEYAEAYRRGYERARRGEEPTEQIRRPEPVQPAPAAVEPTRQLDRDQLTEMSTGISKPESPTPTTTSAPRPASGMPVRALTALLASDRFRDRRVLAAALGALAVVVVVAAFGIGRLFADQAAQSQAGAQGGASTRHGRAVYQGAVQPATIADAMATCQTDDGVDAAGNRVTYEPAKAYDEKLSTAWRCDGSGKGERFTVTLPKETVVAEVGLVPGYAKTDPASGADRYAENNRITKVRWRFDDGTTFVQRMSGDPGNRKMRVIRLPETSTRRVVLEILASQPGPRNTVAISELRIASPQG